MRTLRYALARLGGMVLVLLIVAFCTFVVFYLVPSDPALLACGKSSIPAPARPRISIVIIPTGPSEEKPGACWRCWRWRRESSNQRIRFPHESGLAF